MITDNELSVIIDIGDKDAAYTAEEAREFAQSLQSTSDQRWNSNNDDIVEYICDLADVVDGLKTCEEVKEKWENRDTDNTVSQ